MDSKYVWGGVALVAGMIAGAVLQHKKRVLSSAQEKDLLFKNGL